MLYAGCRMYRARRHGKLATIFPRSMTCLQRTSGGESNSFWSAVYPMGSFSKRMGGCSSRDVNCKHFFSINETRQNYFPLFLPLSYSLQFFVLFWIITCVSAYLANVQRRIVGRISRNALNVFMMLFFLAIQKNSLINANDKADKSKIKRSRLSRDNEPHDPFRKKMFWWDQPRCVSSFYEVITRLHSVDVTWDTVRDLRLDFVRPIPRINVD